MYDMYDDTYDDIYDDIYDCLSGLVGAMDITHNRIHSRMSQIITR